MWGGRRCHRGVEWRWEGAKGRWRGVKDRWRGTLCAQPGNQYIWVSSHNRTNLGWHSGWSCWYNIIHDVVDMNRLCALSWWICVARNVIVFYRISAPQKYYECYMNGLEIKRFKFTFCHFLVENLINWQSYIFCSKFYYVIELSILLFADDVVVIAVTVHGLQRKINVLYNVSCILGLEVHAGKSNIVVFRNGGHLAANEKWHICMTDLNIVSEYTYSGIVVSTSLNPACIQNHLATRARSAVARIDKSIRHLHDLEL